MATQTAADTVRPALLFMPDISGFTEFVNSTEILHAQNIIQEVLEILIESNQLNLEVGEIEGDAIFFYRLGEPPSLNQLLQQVHTMFTRFHQHLLLYNHQRICPCGACSSAINLKLKIIAHFGEVAGLAIKKFQKLFGKEVIVIHRLLKNNLNKKEYALFTHSLLNSASFQLPYPPWYMPEKAVENYDVGEIEFSVADLTQLHQELPPVELPVYRLSDHTKVAFAKEKFIEAPMLQVFGAVFDLSQRINWMEGIKKIEIVTKDSINRVGTLHRCILDKKSDSVVVTEYAHIGAEEIELVEMNENGIGGCRYLLYRINEKETNVKIEMLVKNNVLIPLVFSLFMKNKFKRQIENSLVNLAAYCLAKPIEVAESV